MEALRSGAVLLAIPTNEGGLGTLPRPADAICGSMKRLYDKTQATIPQTRVGGLVTGFGRANASRLLSKLARNQQDAVMLVIGDSTGNETIEWVYLFLQGLAARYPTHTVRYYLYDSTANGNLGGYSAAVKRERGIANGAGVSVVRANREVDFGWFFLNGKRRENYDDWWRCEVRFDPVLDEAFGITHTKQQIRPQEHLTAVLTPDIESMAKALNSRVRQAHLRLKAGEATRAAEQTAADRERLLTPLPKPPQDAEATAVVKSLLKQVPALKDEPVPEGQPLDYRIVEANMKETCFFSFAITNGRFVLVLNPEHPFFRKVYRPLSELETPEAKQARTHLDLVLLAAARAEAAASRSEKKGCQRQPHAVE